MEYLCTLKDEQDEVLAQRIASRDETLNHVRIFIGAIKHQEESSLDISTLNIFTRLDKFHKPQAIENIRTGNKLIIQEA